MRSASTQLKARLAVDATTLARLWVVTRSDGLILRFTDAVRPLAIDVGDGSGVQTFRSDISFTASAVFVSRSAANLQSYTMTIAMDDDGFKEVDVRQRLYDGATSNIYVCDYANLGYGVVNMFVGSFGGIQLSDQKIMSVTVQPTTAVSATSTIGLDRYSQTCRASLGDSKCKVNLTALAVPFTVTSAAGGSIVASAFSQADNSLALGFIQWLTGANAGTTSQVQTNNAASTSVFLLSPPAAPIAPGDTGKIFPGCDKTRTTCLNKFNNVVNLRAEPDVPMIGNISIPNTMFGG